MILRTEGLTKTFEVGFRRRRVHAVQDLSLSVAQGEIFGFLGPNGAGKTTTIKMLMGLIFPTSGRASIFDAPIPSREAKARIGYLPEHPAFHEFLTGREVLSMFAELAGVGVKRVSVGGAFARAAYGAFLRAAREVRTQGTFTFGRDAIPHAEINAMFKDDA